MWLTVGLFLLLSMETVSASEWCYQAQVSCNKTCAGPEVWQEVSQQCGGGSQSPVNIITRRLFTNKRLTPFHLHGYQESFHGRFTNNGHTVQLDLPAGIMIRGGNLAKNYKAIQLHLHWGKNGAGSEHTIDGEQFPMEMHIVHIKEEYDSLSQAVKDRTGVAVLGFWFQVCLKSPSEQLQLIQNAASGVLTRTKRESKSANKNYDRLVEALTQIIEPYSNTMLTDVSLEMLIPPRDVLTRYFRYDGSLTTPDCAEAVVWTLFESPIPLSRSQLSAFCQLRFSDGKQMVQTNRPVQPLNGRLVYYSKGHFSVVSWVLLIMSVLFSCTLVDKHFT